MMHDISVFLKMNLSPEQWSLLVSVGLASATPESAGNLHVQIAELFRAAILCEREQCATALEAAGIIEGAQLLRERQTPAPTPTDEAVSCPRCGKFLGRIVAENNKPVRLVIPSGFAFRFPFSAICPCGRPVRWRAGWGKLIPVSS
jgi:hypothetical protein